MSNWVQWLLVIVGLDEIWPHQLLTATPFNAHPRRLPITPSLLNSFPLPLTLSLQVHVLPLNIQGLLPLLPLNRTPRNINAKKRGIKPSLGDIAQEEAPQPRPLWTTIKGFVIVFFCLIYWFVKGSKRTNVSLNSGMSFMTCNFVNSSLIDLQAVSDSIIYLL